MIAYEGGFISILTERGVVDQWNMVRVVKSGCLNICLIMFPVLNCLKQREELLLLLSNFAFECAVNTV
jgi:hypothetical protein